MGDFVSFHEAMLKNVDPAQCNVWHLRRGLIVEILSETDDVVVFSDGEFFNVNSEAISYDMHVTFNEREK